MAYHRVHGVQVRIARIFNTYGPRMRPNDGRAIPAFISQALNQKPVTIFGTGKQTRSFCYVEDEVEGLLRLLTSSCVGPMNIGNPREMTVEECARMVIKICGSRSPLIKKPLPVDDPKVRQPDISLAKRVLKWQPRIPAEEGLKKTIEWFRISWKLDAQASKRIKKSSS
jgi:dTDP-glucose 4,6-dehydratase